MMERLLRSGGPAEEQDLRLGRHPRLQLLLKPFLPALCLIILSSCFASELVFQGHAILFYVIVLLLCTGVPACFMLTRNPLISLLIFDAIIVILALLRLFTGFQYDQIWPLSILSWQLDTPLGQALWTDLVRCWAILALPGSFLALGLTRIARDAYGYVGTLAGSVAACIVCFQWIPAGFVALVNLLKCYGMWISAPWQLYAALNADEYYSKSQLQLGNATMPGAVFDGFDFSNATEVALYLNWRPIVWGLTSWVQAIVCVISFVRAMFPSVARTDSGPCTNCGLMVCFSPGLLCAAAGAAHLMFLSGFQWTFAYAQQMWLYDIEVVKRVVRDEASASDVVALLFICWYAGAMVYSLMQSCAPSSNPFSRDLESVKDAFDVNGLVGKADAEGGFHANIKRTFSRQMTGVLNAGGSIRTIGVKDANSKQKVADVNHKRNRLLLACQDKAIQDSGTVTNKNPPWKIHVSRSTLLTDSFEAINKRHAWQLLSAGKFEVQFAGEQGLDWGGVRRDWFTSVATKLFQDAQSNADDGLFALAEDGTLVPRPTGQARAKDLVGCGRFIAYCISQKEPVPLPLGAILTKYMCGETIVSADVRNLDPQFYKNRIKLILDAGGIKQYEDIMMEPPTFMSAPSANAEISVPLKKGGQDIQVTDENKEEYCRMLCEAYLCEGIRQELKYLLDGFHNVIPDQFLADQAVNHRDLILMINGVQELNVQEWRQHTQHPSGLSPEDQRCIDEFWSVVDELDNQQRAKLLQFSTGSACLPPGGFLHLRPAFKLGFDPTPPTFLPTSHTCFNQLLIPRYPSKEHTSEKIKQAISQTSEGFGFA